MPHRRVTTGHRDFARNLRRNTTDAEGLLWWGLRDRQLGGWRFRRQVPFGPYVLDFYCSKARLVVELDGSQHRDETDRIRDTWLEARGLRVIRFGNTEVFADFDAVLDTILLHIEGEERVHDHSPLVGESTERSDVGGG